MLHLGIGLDAAPDVLAEHPTECWGRWRAHADKRASGSAQPRACEHCWGSGGDRGWLVSSPRWSAGGCPDRGRTVQSRQGFTHGAASCRPADTVRRYEARREANETLPGPLAWQYLAS
jgi:hypothetical protein